MYDYAAARNIWTKSSQLMEIFFKSIHNWDCHSSSKISLGLGHHFISAPLIFFKGRDSPFVRIVSSSCFPDSSVGKEFACSVGDLGLISGLGRSPGEGKRYPLQYSGLENSVDYIVHGVTRSQTQLSNFHFLSSSWCFQILDMMPEFYLDCLLFPLSSCILLSTFLTYFFLILISMKPESVAIATEWEFLSTSEVALIISPSYGYQYRLLE